MKIDKPEFSRERCCVFSVYIVRLQNIWTFLCNTTPLWQHICNPSIFLFHYRLFMIIPPYRFKLPPPPSASGTFTHCSLPENLSSSPLLPLACVLLTCKQFMSALSIFHGAEMDVSCQKWGTVEKGRDKPTRQREPETGRKQEQGKIKKREIEECKICAMDHSSAHC